MEWFQKTITLRACPRGFHLVTGEIVDELPELASIRTGMLHLFIQHTSAFSLIVSDAEVCWMKRSATF